MAARLPYNRALHPDDYQQPDLARWVEEIGSVELRLRQAQAPYRKDHTHRDWEYANVLHQLDMLTNPITGSPRVLDTGSGASTLPVILKTNGWQVDVSDSMDYGDITDWVSRQCHAFDITLPVFKAAVQNLASIHDDTYDATLCVSVIEHLAPEHFVMGLAELFRVTKPGGYVMITSDYFASREAHELSPYKSIQHNVFTPHSAQQLLDHLEAQGDAEVVGGTDLTYRGDFVNNYSFVNFCLRKPA